MGETVARPDGERAESHAAGLVSPERLIFFSDAVIAIAITLLALELPTPGEGVHGDSAVLAFLRTDAKEYLAFLISFFVIALHWLAHQRLFRYAEGLVLRVIQWDLLWLLMLVVMPFTTKMLTGEFDAFRVQFSIYAVDQALAALFLVLAFRSLRRNRLLRADTPPEAITDTTDSMIAVVVVFLVSIPVAFLTPWASVSWILWPVARRAVHLIRRRSPAA